MLIRHAQLTDIPAIARVHVDSWRTTCRGIVSDDYLAKLSYQQREIAFRERWMVRLSASCCGQLAKAAHLESRRIIDENRSRGCWALCLVPQRGYGI
jgi:hypothetical protein